MKDGHSVYENTCGTWADGQVPVEFLTVYGEEGCIRQHTKGMNSDEVHKFAIAYYGWDDNEEEVERYLQNIPKDMKLPVYKVSDEKLPFS